MTHHLRFAMLILVGLGACTASAQSVRFDCGGPGFGSGGLVFLADRPYSPQSGAGFVGGRAVRAGAGGGRVEGTRWPQLFGNVREGVESYRFDLPAGTYVLELHLAETLRHGPEQRVFSVQAEGVVVLQSLDLFALVEKDYALIYRLAVTVTDGRLDVAFPAATGEALVAAIGVQRAAADAIAPPPPSQCLARGSYHRNIVTWGEVAQPDHEGFRVERAPASTGPFEAVGGTLPAVLRYLDDDVEAGQTWYYRVRAVDVWGNESGPSVVAGATVRNTADSDLPVYFLDLASEELAVLQADPFSDDYVDGGFAHREVLHEGVGIRYRGNVTRHRNKKSWKVDFPGDGPFLGMDKLNINAESNDTTLLKERLCYDLLSALNVHAPSASFARVEVNGEYRGVFTRVENVDLEFVDRRGLDTSGNLYKADGPQCGFERLPNLAQYQAAWEMKTDGEGGWDDLVALIELVNLTPDDELLVELASVMNVDALLDYYAAVVLTANFDHVFHNYYVYHDVARGIWELFPKDWNGTFGDPHFAVDYGTANHPGGPGGGNSVNTLMTRVLGVPQLRQRYAAKLLELLDGDFSPASVEPRVEAYFAEIEEEGLIDVFKIGAERDIPFVDGPRFLEGWVVQRGAWLRGQAELYAPGLEIAVMVNEVAAQEGAEADWVELYNPGTAAVDLEGWSLDDDVRGDGAWEFPEGVVIAAKGRLVVRADGDPGAGPEHAAFTLPDAGGVVALFGPDAQGRPLVGHIAFGPQPVGLSFGRRYDGSALWTAQGEPSPGSPNSGRGNMPPVIWAHRRTPEIPVASQDVAVTAMIEDPDGLLAATLWYDDGQGWVAASLRDDGNSDDEAAGDGLYGGVIPAPAVGEVVRYFLEAEDSFGRVSRRPRNAGELYVCSAGSTGDGPVLNELLADNSSVLADESGEYDDWLELYNPGAEELDLSGMFLSDDLADPQKWELPAGTVIEAGGYLLVWADGQPDQGPLHADFRLDADGEELGLFATLADGNGLIDGLAFGAQQPDVSYGRSPDGAGSWVLLLAPTPGGPNGLPPREAGGRLGPTP